MGAKHRKEEACIRMDEGRATARPGGARRTLSNSIYIFSDAPKVKARGYQNSTLQRPLKFSSVKAAKSPSGMTASACTGTV